MSERCRIWSEKQLVDGVLGNLPDFEQEKLRRHVRSCMDCGRRYEAWREILAGRYLNLPPERVKIHLLKKAKRRMKQRKRYISPSLRRGLMAVPTVFCIWIAVVIVASIWTAGGESPVQRFDRQTPNDTIRQMVRYASVQTRSPSLQAMPIQHDDASGTLWINLENMEMVIYIEGMRMEEGLSLVRQNGWHDVGLLKWNRDSGYIYLRANDKADWHDFWEQRILGREIYAPD